MTQQERKKNAWIEHIQAYSKEHNVPYRIAIKEAKSTYTPIQKPEKVVKPPKPDSSFIIKEKVKRKAKPKSEPETEPQFQPTAVDMVEHNIVAVINTKKKNKK
jgi:hypothetical protein